MTSHEVRKQVKLTQAQMAPLVSMSLSGTASGSRERGRSASCRNTVACDPEGWECWTEPKLLFTGNADAMARTAPLRLLAPKHITMLAARKKLALWTVALSDLRGIVLFTRLWRSRYGSGIAVRTALLLLIAFSAFGAMESARTATESPARLFAASALAFRTAGLAGEGSAMSVLSTVPGAKAVPGELLPALWRPFFENAIVKLGRLNAPVPVALYFNPLLDVAVFTLWRRQGDAYVVHRVRVLPGERLDGPGAPVSLFPAWIATKSSPPAALARITAERLERFGRRHPAAAQAPGLAMSTFADAAANARDAMARLAWNTAQRSVWTDAGLPWLGAMLSKVEDALNSGDAASLTAVAPETDAGTAAALAQLPRSFVERLSLDMVLGAAENGHILVGSVPEEGGVYIFAACRMADGVCELRRFALLSVTE